jgi:hypothetical protein
MKRFILIISILSGLFFLTPKEARACNFSGISISYTHISGYNYKIKLKFYRDCTAVSAPSSTIVNLSCASNPAFNYSILLSRVPQYQEITQACNSNVTACGSGNLWSVEEYVYEGIASLPPCSKWRISYSACARNLVTTIPSNNTNCLYIEALLYNQQAADNSSPVLNLPALFLAPKDEVLHFNPAAYDPDGDSLEFSFYHINTNNDSTYVTYDSGYSFQNFIGSSIPIKMDSSSGQFIMKPNMIGNTNYGIRIREWRKINGTYTLVGTTHQDLTLLIYNANNHSPVLSGMIFNSGHNYSPADTTYYVTAAAREQIAFNIAGYDQDTLDPTASSHKEIFTIKWNQGIPDGNFTVYDNATDSARANFKWTPRLDDIRGYPYCFSVEARDSACPFNGLQRYNYCILVNRPPKLDLGNDTTLCDNDIIILDGDSGNYTYLWSNGDTTRQMVFNAQKAGLGIHTVFLSRSGYGVTETDTILISVKKCVGIDEVGHQTEVYIRPNPSKGIFHIELSGLRQTTIDVEIFNSFGAGVYSKRFRTNGDVLQQTIDLSALAKGVYFLKAGNGRNAIYKKIIIQ